MRSNEQARDEVAQARKRARRLCYTLENGAYPIELRQRGIENFTVIYGLQIKENMTYGDAASELGACIMHKLTCDDMLDNREK